MKKLSELEDDGKITLYYFDESGFTQKPYLPYAWGPVGEQRLMPSYSHSKRLNVLGFLSRKGELIYHTTEARVNTDVVITAFEKMLESKSAQETVFVVLDNASVHKSAKFKEQSEKWVAKKVFVVYLPAYSPELNIIEILWRKIKYEWLPSSAYKTFEELKMNVISLLDKYESNLRINFA